MLETLDRIVRNLFLRNLHLKVIAALLTLALYIWVSVDREVERTRYAPLNLDPPAEMVLVNDPPDKVAITVRGKWSDLTQLESDQLDEISLQIEPSMGRTGRIPLTAELVDLPPGLRALDVQPNYVRYRLEAKENKRVPVRPKLEGDPADGYQLQDVTIRPRTIEISGPSSHLDEIENVSTEPVELSGRTQSFEKKVRPRIADPLVDYPDDRPLVVRVNLNAQKVRKTLSNLSVEAVNTTFPTTVEPGRVTLTVRGPKAVLDELARAQIRASLDLGEEQRKGPGTFEKEVKIRNLPSDVELVDVHPKYFRVHVHPKEASQRNE